MRLLGTVVAGIVAVTSVGCKPRTSGSTAAAGLAQDRAAIDSVRHQYAATWRTRVERTPIADLWENISLCTCSDALWSYRQAAP